MTEELKNAIEQLRSISPKLNQATNDVNIVVEEVEKFLNSECSLGISSEVYLHEECIQSEVKENDESSYQPKISKITYLKYGRLDGKYRIHLMEAKITHVPYEESLVVDREIAWGSCPRELRLRAFVKLPELLENLANTAQSMIKQATGTIEQVQQITDALGISSDKPANID